MTPTQTLADYLTGPRVAMHSMGLQLGEQPRREAAAFFALREAFGVSGYMGPEDAERAIRMALNLSLEGTPND